MSLVKEFLDKQRALNIDKKLIEVEKLAPEMFEKIEIYIKGSMDMLETVAKKNPSHCCDRRKEERRVEEEPDLIPDGMDRRSGMDRRKAS